MICEGGMLMNYSKDREHIEPIVPAGFFNKLYLDIGQLVKDRIKQLVSDARFEYLESNHKKSSERNRFLIDALGILNYPSMPNRYLIGSGRVWILTGRQPTHTPTKICYDQTDGLSALGSTFPSTLRMYFEGFKYHGHIKYCSVFSYNDMFSYDHWLLLEDGEDDEYHIAKAIEYDLSPNGTLVRE
jgi:hypothetical protein